MYFYLGVQSFHSFWVFFCVEVASIRGTKMFETTKANKGAESVPGFRGVLSC